MFLCRARARCRRSCRSSIPQLPSLLLLPIQFPDYNDIDAIDSENVIRFGLRNTLQTKRAGQLDTSAGLEPDAGLAAHSGPISQTNLDDFSAPQKTFNDLYSDLSFKPRSWITLESKLRYDINDGKLNLTFHQLTFTPNERWSWGVGHWYLRSGFTGHRARISSPAPCFTG